MARKTYTNKTKPINPDFEAVILAGGMGSRLKKVLGDRPKILAEIDGEPFLDILVKKLEEQGVSRIILCLGHMKEDVISYVKAKKSEDDTFRMIDFALEEKPLGTGGAVKNALPIIKNEHFFLVNGDTLWKNISFKDLYDFHTKKQSTISIALCPKTNAKEYGRIVTNRDNLIIRFAEKQKTARQGLVSAGLYLIHKDAFAGAHEENEFSLEYNSLPLLIKKGACYGLETTGDFLDIGTPERLDLAENFLHKEK